MVPKEDPLNPSFYNDLRPRLFHGGLSIITGFLLNQTKSSPPLVPAGRQERRFMLLDRSFFTEGLDIESYLTGQRGGG
jgi:hypothetical protein